ncbi:MAG: hypothetical protein LBL92_06300 [Propionibacteriaceae bacterium]|jgi:hypothetical protein|nr:hypothetical protein [Propionibacteriaceae bacterium]
MSAEPAWNEPIYPAAPDDVLPHMTGSELRTHLDQIIADFRDQPEQGTTIDEMMARLRARNQ